MLSVAIQCQSHQMLAVVSKYWFGTTIAKVVSLYLIYISSENFATVLLFSQAWGWGHLFVSFCHPSPPPPSAHVSCWGLGTLIINHWHTQALELATNIIIFGCYLTQNDLRVSNDNIYILNHPQRGMGFKKGFESVHHINFYLVFKCSFSLQGECLFFSSFF